MRSLALGHKQSSSPSRRNQKIYTQQTAKLNSDVKNSIGDLTGISVQEQAADVGASNVVKSRKGSAYQDKNSQMQEPLLLPRNTVTLVGASVNSKHSGRKKVTVRDLSML